MSNKLSGLNPLAYMGVESANPPTIVIQPQAPTIYNVDFQIGTVWIDSTLDSVYILTNLYQGVATWTAVEKNILTVNAGTGSAIQTNNEISLLGSGVITTTGATDTVTIGFTNGTNGQLLIGGGSAPTWASLTSSGGSLTLTPGANSLNLEVTGGTVGSTTFATDSGTANVAGVTITVAGGTNLNTSGAGSTVTVNLDNSPSVSGSVTAATGFVATTGGLSVVSGGVEILAGDLEIVEDVRISSFTEGVIFSNSSGNLSSTKGTNGQIIIGKTGDDPLWANITSSGGTIGVTNGANSINLETLTTGVTWTGPTTDTPIQMVVNYGYIIAGTGQKIRVLPATSAVGDTVRTSPGTSTAYFRITQNAGQIIYADGTYTTLGVGGYLICGAVELVCIEANTTWRMISALGSWTAY